MYVRLNDGMAVDMNIVQELYGCLADAVRMLFGVWTSSGLRSVPLGPELPQRRTGPPTVSHHRSAASAASPESLAICRQISRAPPTAEQASLSSRSGPDYPVKAPPPSARQSPTEAPRNLAIGPPGERLRDRTSWNGADKIHPADKNRRPNGPLASRRDRHVRPRDAGHAAEMRRCRSE